MTETDNETVQRWAAEAVPLRPAKRADYVLRRSDSKSWYIDRTDGHNSDYGGTWSADQVVRMLEPSREAESALHARDERILELAEALENCRRKCNVGMLTCGRIFGAPCSCGAVKANAAIDRALSPDKKAP